VCDSIGLNNFENRIEIKFLFINVSMCSLLSLHEKNETEKREARISERTERRPTYKINRVWD